MIWFAVIGIGFIVWDIAYWYSSRQAEANFIVDLHTDFDQFMERIADMFVPGMEWGEFISLAWVFFIVGFCLLFFGLYLMMVRPERKRRMRP